MCVVCACMCAVCVCVRGHVCGVCVHVYVCVLDNTAPLARVATSSETSATAQARAHLRRKSAGNSSKKRGKLKQKARETQAKSAGSSNRKRGKLKQEAQEAQIKSAGNSSKKPAKSVFKSGK